MREKYIRKLHVALILAFLITAVLVTTASANSAEPPGLTVVVSFPPDGLTLSISFADGSTAEAVELQKEQRAWESYYRFYYWMVVSERPSLEGAVLEVRSNEINFECPIPEGAFSQYNNLLTLDIDSERVEPGQSPARQVLLVSMRVVLTLLIEGLVFLAFGYRSKVSWTAFVVVNLITQGALNILLSGVNQGSYWFFAFAFYELVIFIAEMVSFSIVLKERKKSRAVLCALAANAASLVLGGVLISCLPV